VVFCVGVEIGAFQKRVEHSRSGKKRKLRCRKRGRKWVPKRGFGEKTLPFSREGIGNKKGGGGEKSFLS